MIIHLPDDVISWLKSVFLGCNERISYKLTRIPTLHETHFDFTFIEHLSQYSAPHRFPSDWVVRIHTYYLGGGRHLENWEIADIGILVIFRRGGKLIRSKVALLQSKRLYPDEQDFEEDSAIDYQMGFGRLFPPDEPFASISQARRFSFTESSKYKALVVGDDQYNRIAEYEAGYGIPVYYLLYNPWQIPWTTDIPIRGELVLDQKCSVGCRVQPARQLRIALGDKGTGYKPTYVDLKFVIPESPNPDVHAAGWRLEHFVVELLLRCQTGYLAERRDDEGLFRILNLRSGPIAAAIAVTFDEPS